VRLSKEKKHAVYKTREQDGRKKKAAYCGRLREQGGERVQTLGAFLFWKKSDVLKT
jgi:hypothetical protein